MIVLVNEQTQSLAESVSSQLSQRENTKVMGSQTAGTTGNVNHFNLPGGIETYFTSVGYEGENESFVQKKGVKIDLPFIRTLEQLKNDGDAMLNAALKEIKRGLN